MKYHPKKIKPPHSILGLVYCPEYCSEEYVVEWVELSKIEAD